MVSIPSVVLPPGRMSHRDRQRRAGQPGLATAQRLRNRGRECVILDHNQRIGDGRRRQWDSLRLYSPAAQFDERPA